MYAIVKTGGKQYRVERGQKLLVERLPVDEGADVTLEPLLFRSEDTVFDKDGLAGVQVTAKVLGHVRGEKLRVFKFKPKRGYKRRTGHRQELTQIEVVDISHGAKAPAKAKAEAEAKEPQAQAVPKAPAKAEPAAKGKAKAKAEPAKAKAEPAKAKAEPAKGAAKAEKPAGAAKAAAGTKAPAKAGKAETKAKAAPKAKDDAKGKAAVKPSASTKAEPAKEDDQNGS